MIKSGIYMIINWYNGKYYFGSTTNFNDRQWKHEYLLNKNSHPNRHLQFAWNLYGADAFEFIIIEEVSDLSKLEEIEQLWINASNCCDDQFGYNICPNANSTIGFKASEETKRKISLANKGKKLSAEHIEKISIANRGKTFSAETRAKMSIERQKRVTKDETRIKMSNNMQNNKYSVRKLDKWPHENGRKCECDECIEKKRQLYNDWHRKWRSNKQVGL